jgi:squalene synthase HpnC
VTPIAPERLDAPDAGAVMARAASENFSVASRLLPRRERAHLLAIYGFARLVDELGDSYVADREQALDWLAEELERAFAQRATHPLLITLQGSIATCGLTRDPFLRLIEANRVDQRVASYATWEDLRGYCALSADPVGELVLQVFAMATPERVALSDSICTALQLIEHCQDVAEDLAAGRVYLPLEDLERFGCHLEDLQAAHAGAALRATIAFELARSRTLLAAGRPLLAALHGRARLGVAAYIAGGLAAVRAIERADMDVLAGAPSAGRPARAAAFAGVLARPRRRAR